MFRQQHPEEEHHHRRHQHHNVHVRGNVHRGGEGEGGGGGGGGGRLRRSNLLVLMGLPPNNNNSITNRCLNYATLEPNWDAVERYLHAHPEEASICDVAPLPSTSSSNGNMNNNNYNNNNNNMMAGLFHNNNHHAGAGAFTQSSSSSCIRFSPLYIALRNEVHPVPYHIVALLLQLSFTNTINNVNNVNHNHNNNNNNSNDVHINEMILNNDTILMAMRNPKTTSKIMNALLHIRPTFPKMKYHWYTTPLHVVAKNGTSIGAIGEFIRWYPNSLLKVDKIENGRLPLHIACCDNSWSSSFEIVDLLIREGSSIVMELLDGGDDGEENVNGNSVVEDYTSFIGGGLFHKDALGMTPIHCALYKMKYLEDCRGNNCSGDRSIGNEKLRGAGGTSSSCQHWYLNSTEYDQKCYNAWKVLSICIIHASNAIKTHQLSATAKRRRNIGPSLVDDETSLHGSKSGREITADTPITAPIAPSSSTLLHALIDLISMEPSIFTFDSNVSSSGANSTCATNMSRSKNHHISYNNLFRLVLHPKYSNPKNLASTVDQLTLELPFHRAVALTKKQHMLQKKCNVGGNVDKHRRQQRLTLNNGLQYVLEAYPAALLTMKNFSPGIIPQLMATLANSNKATINGRKTSNDDFGGLHLVFDVVRNAPLLFTSNVPSTLECTERQKSHDFKKNGDAMNTSIDRRSSISNSNRNIMSSNRGKKNESKCTTKRQQENVRNGNDHDDDDLQYHEQGFICKKQKNEE